MVVPPLPGRMITVVRDGMLYELREALDSRTVHVDSKDDEGSTMLRIAAFDLRYAHVKLLLERGADPNETDDEGGFALLNASLNAVGVNPLTRDDAGVQEAARRVGLLLLSHGAQTSMPLPISISEAYMIPARVWAEQLPGRRQGHGSFCSLGIFHDSPLPSAAPPQPQPKSTRAASANARTRGCESAARSQQGPKSTSDDAAPGDTSRADTSASNGSAPSAYTHEPGRLLVTIAGLLARSDLNGMRADVISQPRAPSERWGVRCIPTGEAVRVKPSNLHVRACLVRQGCWEAVSLSADAHAAIVREGDTPPVATLIGLSLRVKRLETQPFDPRKDDRVAALDNQPVTYLMIAPSTGLAPTQWSGNVGACHVARTDGDLHEHDFTLIHDFLNALLDEWGHETPPRTPTPDRFQKYIASRCLAHLKGDRPRPDFQVEDSNVRELPVGRYPVSWR